MNPRTTLSFRRFLAALLVLLCACQPEERETPVPEVSYADAAQATSREVNNWLRLSLKITLETPGFTAPVAARAFGYSGLALYEAIWPGIKDHRSLQGRLSGFNTGTLPPPDPEADYNWEIAANAALAEVFRGLYRSASAENLAAIEELEREARRRLSQNVPGPMVDISENYGRRIGKLIYQFSTTDGQDNCFQNNYPINYTPPGGPGKWAPTPPNFQRALQPFWGKVRPFLDRSVPNAQPPTPPAYSSATNSTFYLQALEVYILVKNGTPEQRDIARYWNDEPERSYTPPGHAMAILLQILEKENANLAQAALAYLKMGIGLHDTMVACWRYKFDFNVMRPLPYIQAFIDRNFTVPVIMHPVPDYTSDHAAVATAAATVLSDIFGYVYEFTDNSHAGNPAVQLPARSFSSFLEYSEEVADSRLYGGSHFRAGIEAGQRQGIIVGRLVSQLEVD